MAIELTAIGTYATGIFDEGAAEIPDYDPDTQRLFVVNGANGAIDVLDTSDPTNPTFEFALTLSTGSPNSVAVKDGIVAIAVADSIDGERGDVVFFDTDGIFLNSVEVGVLPDMLTYTPDGTKILVADEGEPVDGADPEGTISIIDISAGVGAVEVTTADFTAFNGFEDTLRAEGIRIFPDRPASEDFEPEYIAVSEDSTTAYATLQENNAVAVVDIASATVTNVLPLGVQDFSIGGGLDASDEDGGINIQNQPVYGLRMPDAIATFKAKGKTYFATANEGDDRGDADEDEFGDAIRVGDLGDVTSFGRNGLALDKSLDPAIAEDENLGRLTISSLDGDVDGDGDLDQLFSYGSRSFSIYDAKGNLVFDSGDQLEQITADLFPNDFNSDNDENGSFDSRSDNKGPEPEGITVGTIGSCTYAFVGLERIGGIAVYDVSNPAKSEFVQYINNRNFSGDAEAGTAGDLGPEGLEFISAEDSPTGRPLLAVANEVSGTTTIYQIDDLSSDPSPTNPTSDPANPTSDSNFTLQLLHASDLEGGVDAIQNAPNFAAIANYFDSTFTTDFGGSLIVSAGDNYLPGPFLSAAGAGEDGPLEETLRSVFERFYQLDSGALSDLEADAGRVDIAIMNLIGFDASVLGNHEFDLGTSELANIIGTELDSGFDGSDPGTIEWFGAQFPYLSANLDFSADEATAELFTNELRNVTEYLTNPDTLENFTNSPEKIAPSALAEVDGEIIGILGITTPLLETITSTGNVDVIDPETSDLQALADLINPQLDALAAQTDKIIVTAHLQQYSLAEQLVPLLNHPDVFISGGSDTIQLDENDFPFPGTEADINQYPVILQNADGSDTALVSTDGEYRYVGRLVIQFDDQGNIVTGSIDRIDSGAYETSNEGVLRVVDNGSVSGDSNGLTFADDSFPDLVQELVSSVSDIVTAQDSNILGLTDVYLEGERSAVRTEETNLGNLTADANLVAAQAVDETVVISLKNGGGIRSAIGEVDSVDGTLLPPQANPVSGKEEGQISELDVANSLRFNNGLTLLTLRADEILQVLEHAVAETGDGNTPGQFAQIGGISFSFDATQPVGDRVISAAVINEDGTIADELVENGELVGDPSRTFRIVTLNFLADGGDDYPFFDFEAADPARVNRVDLSDLNGDGETDEVFTGNATFVPDGTEQDALAEYLLDNFSTTPFADAETLVEDDTRIQNLAFRDDTVLDGSTTPISSPTPSPSGGIDFEGDDLTAGTIVTDQLTGLTVTADGFGAMIFDTANPTGGDNDLAGDTLGNVLILSEDGDTSDADDSAAGGTFQFAFDDLVAIESIKVLDVEEGGTVELFGADGSSLGSVDIAGTANGALGTVNVDTDGVRRMNLTLNGSGAIADIQFG